VRGDEIVFVRHSGPADSRLLVVEPDGSGLRPLTADAFPCSSPAWSPDGFRLVVVARGDSDDGMVVGELHLLDADGTGLKRITRERSVKARPAWSPDGKEIVFERGVGTNGSHLFAIGADGTGLRPITGSSIPEAPVPRPIGERAGWTGYVPLDEEASASEMMPAWSPDGSRIAFVRVVEGPRHDGFAHHLFTVSADGTDERLVTTGRVHDLDPSWSPDGARLVFNRYTDEERLPHPSGGSGSAVRLWLIHPDGSGLQPLTDEPANYMDPDWDPDGSSVVCSRSTGGPTHIFRFDVAEGRGWAITNPDVDGDYEPSWRPAP
jgi:Tol biopolymer transport system component